RTTSGRAPIRLQWRGRWGSSSSQKRSPKGRGSTPTSSVGSATSNALPTSIPTTRTPRSYAPSLPAGATPTSDGAVTTSASPCTCLPLERRALTAQGLALSSCLRYGSAMTVDFADLSAHLAEYLARVRAGETIFVEDKDHVLAKIAPVSDPAEVERQELED